MSYTVVWFVRTTNPSHGKDTKNSFKAFRVVPKGFFYARMRTSVNLPIKMVTKEVSNSLMLSKYAEYRCAYPNNRIYNYKDFKANRTAFSDRTVRIHLQYFIEKGWAVKEGKNLRLLSKKELAKKYSSGSLVVKLDFKNDRTYKHFGRKLYAFILNNKLQQIQYKRDREKYQSGDLTANKGERVSIGMKKIKKLFYYKSLSSATKKVRELEKSGLISVKRYALTPHTNQEDLQGLFVYQNKYFIHRCNEYTQMNWSISAKRKFGIVNKKEGGKSDR